ncbi:MAG: thioesterase [Tissierellia bacterium]|nr:thioesterase [Tissierellia bacterium]
MKTSKDYYIPHFLCGINKKLKLSSLLGFMIETSVIQSNIAEENLDNEKRHWIVYRWKVIIDEFPKYKDNINITTYPTGFNKFYAYRKFEVKNNDKIIVDSLSEFMLYDTDKNRVIKIPKDYVESYGIHEGKFKEIELSMDKDFDNSIDLDIRYSDIDHNGHVNNSKYVDFFKEVIKEREDDIKYIDITYKNEIKYNEKVKLFYNLNDDFFEFEIRSVDKIKTYGKMYFNV